MRHCAANKEETPPPPLHHATVKEGLMDTEYAHRLGLTCVFIPARLDRSSDMPAIKLALLSPFAEKFSARSHRLSGRLTPSHTDPRDSN